MLTAPQVFNFTVFIKQIFITVFIKVSIRNILSQMNPVYISPLLQRLILILFVAYAVRTVRWCDLFEYST